MRFIPGLSLCLGSMSAGMAQATPPGAILTPADPAGPRPMTLQQQFDAATALTEAGKDWLAALAAWEALEPRVKNGRVLGVIRARKSVALFNLKRFDEAAAMARLSLAAMPTSDPALIVDRYQAFINLAVASQGDLDYTSASDAFRSAAALDVSPQNKLTALRGAVETGTFVDLAAADRDLIAANDLAKGLSLSRKEEAALKIAEAELRLNEKRFDDARSAARTAVGLLGGLTELIDHWDVAARSDYAIAALLLGRKDDAREYIAATGAGRFGKGTFDAGSIKVPQCGGDLGLKPDDATVLQFSIDGDGKVTASRPVYAAGGGQAGLAFARAARDWSFIPQNIASFPGFFKWGIRVELRCSMSFERPQATGIATDALNNWLIEKGLSPVSTDRQETKAAQRLVDDRRELDAILKSGNKSETEVAAAMLKVAFNPVVGSSESGDLAKKAREALNGDDIPLLALLAVDLKLYSATYFLKKTARRDIFVQAMSNPPYVGDPQSRSLLRLVLADSLAKEPPATVVPILEQVLEDPGLTANDPLRVGAAVRLASLQASIGKQKEAQAAYDKAGIAPNQCALLDKAPSLLKSRGQFPDEALRYGFEGWTTIETDVGADGIALKPRTIVAYPPFVFSEGGEKFIALGEFTKSFRPDGGLGCGAVSQRINFRMFYK